MKKEIFLLAAVLLCLSCATVPLKPLKSDHLSGKAEEKAVLLLEVELITRTPRFVEDLSEPLPWITVERVEEGKLTPVQLNTPFDINFWTGKKEGNPWVEENGRYVMRYTLASEALCGEYRLKELTFQLGSESYSTYNSTTTTTYFQNFYMNMGFHPEKPGIYTLGKIRMEILDMQGDFPNYTFSSSLRLDQDPQAMMNAFTGFSVGHPALAEYFHYEAEQSPAYYLYFVDFSDLGHYYSTSPWRLTSNEAVEYRFSSRGEYVLEKKITDDSYYFMTNTREVYVPERCDILWTSRITEGEEGKGSGLMFGTDPENCYFFTTLPDGQSGIGFLKDNEWQDMVFPFSQAGGAPVQQKDQNRHRIEKRGARSDYYINGNHVATFKTRFTGETPMIAFFISGKGEVLFDDFIVREIPE